MKLKKLSLRSKLETNVLPMVACRTKKVIDKQRNYAVEGYD